MINELKTRYSLTEEAPLLGYRVFKVNTDSIYGYFLVGKRNSVYSLIRRNNDPSLMFVVNSNMNVVKLKGVEYFTDFRGKLEPIRNRVYSLQKAVEVKGRGK